MWYKSRVELSLLLEIQSSGATVRAVVGKGGEASTFVFLHFMGLILGCALAPPVYLHKQHKSPQHKAFNRYREFRKWDSDQKTQH